MNNYSNPMTTYNEIIEALKAILDCSKANGYLDEYNFLNVRYDALNKSPLYEEQEQALIQAIQSLEKTIDAADKVIRENLKEVLDEIVTSNSFIIPTRYKKDEEYRKLAAQDEFVSKLKEMSLPVEVLSDVPVVPTVEQSEGALDEIESLVEPLEEVEIESLNIPSTEEEEELYYSRVKLGNVKNAFAVTEEQYLKLKDSEKEKEEVDSLQELTFEEAPKKEEKVEEAIPEKEEPIVTEDFTISELPVEKPVESVSEETMEVPAIEEKNEVEEPPKEEEAPTPEKEESESESKEPSAEQKKASLDRIKLIKKALDKAKEKENAQLVQILEQQLRKELEALKS